MAEQPIDKDGFIKAGAIDTIIGEFDKWKAKLIEIDVLIDKLGKSAPIIQPPKNTEDLNKLHAKIQQLEAALKKKSETETKLSAIEKERIKLAKQLETAEAKKVIALNKENKELLELRAETNKLNKEQRESVKTAERQSNAYLKLSDSTRDYKNESKRLGAELLLLEKNGKRNSKEYNDLSLTYARVTKNAQLGDQQLKKLDKTVGDNQRSVGAYENATRKLSSALGALGIAFGISTIVRSTTGVIKDYDQAVTDLGAISQKTAEELKPLTDQARQLGATTQFSATQITELQIELAKLGFTTQEIMDSTGGIANFAAATGVEIPRAAALAGSALRAFNLDATEIDRVVSTLGVATTKTALDFSQLETGLSTIAPVAAAFGFSIEDSTALLGQLSNAGFDASSSATATRNILLNLADANGDLAKQLGRPIKSADDLAAGLQELKDKGIDLASALELTDKRSVAAFSTFMENADTLVDLRDSITDVNGELTEMAEKRLDSVSGAMAILNSAYEEYILSLNESIGASEGFKTAIKFIAENLGTILSVLGRVIIAYGAYRLALIAVNVQQAIADKGLKNIVKGFFSLKKGADDGAKAIGGVGKALKAIGWTALISVAIELATAFYDIASGAKEARRRAKELDDYREQASKDAEKYISNRNKALSDEIDILRRKMEIDTSAAKSEKERNDINTKYLQERKKLIESNSAAIQTQINITEKELGSFEDKLNRINEIENQRVNESDYNKQTELLLERGRLSKELGEQLGITNTAWFGLIESNAEFTQVQSRLQAEIAGTKDELDIYNKELLQSNNNLLDASTSLIVDSNNRENNRSKIEAQTKGLSDLNKERKKEALTLKEIDDLLNSGKTLDEIESGEVSQLLAREAKYRTERLTLIANAEIDESITEDQAREQRLITEIDYLLDKRKILVQYGEDVRDIDLEIANARLSFLKEFNKDTNEEIEEANKEFLDSISSSVTLLKDLYSDEIDFAISKQNELIANSQKTIDNIKAAATAGTSQAKESILAEEKAIEESQKRIDKANKRKARVELISSGINTFNSAVAGGATGLEALGTTAASMTALTALLNSLPSFDVGTERIGVDGRGIDGKGGMLAINHRDERVVDANNNKIIGFDTTNSELAKIANYYNKGLLKPISEVNPMIMQSDNSQILKSINDGFSKINNWNMTIEELFGVISVTVDKSKNGDLHSFNKKFKA